MPQELVKPLHQSYIDAILKSCSTLHGCRCSTASVRGISYGNSANALCAKCTQGCRAALSRMQFSWASSKRVHRHRAMLKSLILATLWDLCRSDEYGEHITRRQPLTASNLEKLPVEACSHATRKSRLQQKVHSPATAAAVSLACTCAKFYHRETDLVG